MESNDKVNKPDTETSLYMGAVATLFVALLPYLNVFILPAYVIGAFVALWHAESRRGLSLDSKQGAKLGFLSTFLGAVVAAVVVDLIWLFFDYQLWQHQNSSLLLAIIGMFASPATMDAMRDAFAQNAAKPFQWYMFLVQVVVNAFMCGIFGALSGAIAAKIFRPGKR